MDLFSRTNLKAAPAKVKQVKTWIAEILNLDKQVAISLNQLTCRWVVCPLKQQLSSWNNRQNNTKFINQLLKYNSQISIN